MRSASSWSALWALLGSSCSHSSPPETSDAQQVDGRADGDAATGSGNPLALTCAVTTSPFAPASCPAPAGTAGNATFCYRPQWPGVTAVDVRGGFGSADDWTTPLASLADQGDGTWAVTVSLTGGPYPYVFHVEGSTDGVIPSGGAFVLDQTNPSFVPAPPQAPNDRSVSELTLPQVPATIYHLHGSVALNAMPQPCFVASIGIGELLKPGGGVLSEHGVANFVEIGADGTFDVPLANGPALVNVTYPFGLTSAYPDPLTTPSIGNARTSTTIADADVTLEATDVTYATAAYQAMSPVSGTSQSPPIAFSWSPIAGASGSYMSITATDIAGNDPAYTSGASGSATTATWDGKFNNGVAAGSGTYYWATWQQRGIWADEGLELPIALP